MLGLTVAAAFALIIPTDAMAQLQGSVDAAQTSIAQPFIKVVSYVSYGLGTVMGVAGIAGLKKHSDNPGSNPIGPPLGRIGASAAFITAPSLVGMLQHTGSGTLQGGTPTFGSGITF